MNAPSVSYFEQCINVYFSFITPLPISSGVVPLTIHHYIPPGPQPLIYLKFFLLSSLNIREHTHTHTHTHTHKPHRWSIILQQPETLGEMRCQNNIHFRPLPFVINYLPSISLCLCLSHLSSFL